MEDRKTVQFGYAASSNITFRGTADSGMTREEWNELDKKAQDEIMTEVLWELVDMWELDDE